MCDAEGMIRDVELTYADPCDVAGVFAWMVPRAVAGVEEASEACFSRTIRLEGGPAWFRIRRDRGLMLDLDTTDAGDVDGLIALVRRVFDLDTDGSAVYGALSAIP